MNCHLIIACSFLMAQLVLADLRPAGAAEMGKDSADDSGPRLVVLSDLDQPRFVSDSDHGNRFEVQLQNQGDSNLELGDMVISCNCAQAKLNKQRLLPNEKATLSLTIKAQGFGKRNVAIAIYTNEFAFPARIVVPYEVHVSPVFETAILDLGVVAPRSEETGEVKILGLTTVAAEDLPRLIAVATSDAVQAVVREDRLSIKVQTQEKLGRNNALVTLGLSDLSRPGRLEKKYQTLQVSWDVVAPGPRTKPATINLGTIDVGKPIRRLISISNTEAVKPPTIKSVQSPVADVSVSCLRKGTRNYNVYEILYTLRPGFDGETSSIYQSTLNLELASGETVELPVIGYVGDLKQKGR